jgi:hypothetical protein
MTWPLPSDGLVAYSSTPGDLVVEPGWSGKHELVNTVQNKK